MRGWLVFRRLFPLCLCVLGVVALSACSEGDGTRGQGGVGGDGGRDAFACTEEGVRAAIAEGGGPHFFACDGRTTVFLQATVVIDRDVILDGEGALILDGTDLDPMLEVAAERAAELRGFELAEATISFPKRIVVNAGMLALTRSLLSILGINNQGTLSITESTWTPGAAWDSAGSYISNFGTATVNRCAFSGTHIANFGALTVTESTFSGASTPSDDSALVGIYNREGGTVALTDSSISGSESSGLENQGSMTVRRCTISDNGASSPSPPGLAGGIINLSGTLSLTNSTVSGNAGSSAGGIHNSGGTLVVASSTMSGNTSPLGVSGIESAGGTVTVGGSVIDGDCRQGAGTITSIGHNVESPGDTCGFDQTGDQSGVTEEQLNLGPLADNGGPTQTHEPGGGGFGDDSFAIDQIPATACLDADGSALTEDQRGQARPESGGSMCDVGAVEVQAAP